MNLRYLQLIFGIGFGACAGFIAGKLYYEKKAEDRADREIDDVKQHYLKKSLENKVDKNVSVVTPAIIEAPDPKPKEEKTKKKKRKKSKTNYSDISKESDDKEHMKEIIEHIKDTVEVEKTIKPIYNFKASN